MAKRIVEVEVTYCDVCESENGWRICMGCGKAYCTDCSRKHTIEFWTGVHGGSTYHACHDCNAALLKSGKNKFFNALKVVESLKKEYEGFFAGFEPRRNKAEEEVGRYRNKD